MKRRGPLLTLLGGAAVGAVLLLANLSATGDGNNQAVPAGDQVTPAASATAGASPPAAEPSQQPAEVPEEPAEPVTYVGYVDGGGASVALIVTGDEAVGYVCDGVAVEAWLAGSARNGELLLTGDNGSLTGAFDDASAAGRVTALGQEWTFTVDAVAPPEGLYRFADTIAGGAEVVGGWIVLPDGRQVGLVTVDGRSAPAPRLDPATGRVDLGDTVVTAVPPQAGG